MAKRIFRARNSGLKNLLLMMVGFAVGEDGGEVCDVNSNSDGQKH
jgi:hypothetical protein